LSKENGAAGTGYYDFIVTNSSSKACTLKGYPEVEVVGGGNGTQIGKPLSHTYWSYKAGVKTNPQLTLKAKSGKAYAQLAVPSIYNYSTDDTQKPVYKADYNSTCGSAVKADGYRMQLPGEGTSLYVAVSGGFPYCSATKQAIARNSEFVSSSTSD
jgi:hypothetical protein